MGELIPMTSRHPPHRLPVSSSNSEPKVTVAAPCVAER